MKKGTGSTATNCMMTLQRFIQRREPCTRTQYKEQCGGIAAVVLSVLTKTAAYTKSSEQRRAVWQGRK
jgi:hypothetical protein